MRVRASVCGKYSMRATWPPVCMRKHVDVCQGEVGFRITGFATPIRLIVVLQSLQ